MKKKARGLDRKAWLALCPWRNPSLEWFEENDRVILHIQRQQNWKTKILNLFVPLPEERKIALDAIGTHVWRLLDGKNTVGAIARSVAKEYKLGEREAELSVQQFFRELSRRGYVGFSAENAEQINTKSHSEKSQKASKKSKKK